jgi:hypothetical protein
MRQSVPFFGKQMSYRKPIPPDLFVRQFPAVSKAAINPVPLPSGKRRHYLGSHS